MQWSCVAQGVIQHHPTICIEAVALAATTQLEAQILALLGKILSVSQGDSRKERMGIHTWGTIYLD